MKKRDMEFRFPLYWAVGLLFHWTTQWYSTLDVSQTRWSDLSFKADGETRINPITGNAHAEDPLDDTWALRWGNEYLFRLKEREIPLRLGVAWEQRPAPDRSDDYFVFGIGSGLTFGQEPHRLLFGRGLQSHLWPRCDRCNSC